MKTITNYTVPSLGFPHIERALIAGYRFSETPPDWSPEVAKYKEEKRLIVNHQEAIPFSMSLNDPTANDVVLRRSLKSLMELPKEHADLLVATMTEVLDANRPEKDLKVPSTVVSQLIQALGSA